MIQNRGTTLCGAPTNAGTPCCDWVVRGFDTCLHHVRPDQLLAAEAACGIRLCRRDPGCRQYAISWSDPPGCNNHLSGLQRQIELRQTIRYQIEQRRAELMTAWFCFAAGNHHPEVLRVLGLDADARQRLAEQLTAGAGDA
jgi:hypothetical protein